MTGKLPPAGWYDDSTMANTRRYWDGSKWTEHRQEKASGAPSPVEPSSSSGTSLWKWIGVIVVAIVLAAVALRVLDEQGVLGGDATYDSDVLADEVEAGLDDKGIKGAELTCAEVGAAIEQGDVTVCDGEDGEGNPVTVTVTFNSDGSYIWETQ